MLWLAGAMAARSVCAELPLAVLDRSQMNRNLTSGCITGAVDWSELYFDVNVPTPYLLFRFEGRCTDIVLIYPYPPFTPELRSGILGATRIFYRTSSLNNINYKEQVSSNCKGDLSIRYFSGSRGYLRVGYLRFRLLD